MKKVAVFLVLSLLFVTLTACNMTQVQREATWRMTARSVGMLASAFSPEAKLVITSCCAVAGGDSKATLQQVWTGLNDLQAYALASLINDAVDLAGLSLNQADPDGFYRPILDAICAGASI